jgi:hypothetical protein
VQLAVGLVVQWRRNLAKDGNVALKSRCPTDQEER